MARTSQLDALSIADLKRAIAARKSKRSDLLKERKKLTKQLAALDRQLELAGAAGRRRGARPRNEKSLAEVLEDVLKSDKPMRVRDIAAAAQTNGYKSNAGNFNAVVNLTLIKNKQFHAAARGLYALKKSS